MKNKPLYNLIILFFFYGININLFGKVCDNFMIIGNMEDAYSGKMIMSYIQNGEVSIRDTSFLVKKGKFNFQDCLNDFMRVALKLKGGNSSDWFYLNSGYIYISTKHTSINSEIINKIEITSIQGSIADSLCKNFSSFCRYLDNTYQPDSINSNLIFLKLLSIVKRFPNHNLSSDLLLDAGDRITYTNAKKIFEYLSKEQKLRVTQMGIKKLFIRLDRTNVGAPYNFISIPDSSGNLRSGKELSYKYLLIEFWSSGCIPCRAENPNLISLYRKYNKLGFEILGISIDENRQSWIKAIKKDQLEWTQLAELNGWHGKFPDYYALSFIPFNLLIDKKGIIIAKDLRGEVLAQRLTALFNN